MCCGRQKARNWRYKRGSDRHILIFNINKLYILCFEPYGWYEIGVAPESSAARVSFKKEM